MRSQSAEKNLVESQRMNSRQKSIMCKSRVRPRDLESLGHAKFISMFGIVSLGRCRRKAYSKLASIFKKSDHISIQSLN